MTAAVTALLWIVVVVVAAVGLTVVVGAVIGLVRLARRHHPNVTRLDQRRSQR
jgi:cytochrome c-type biogenesis protein CcmH/NrfF